jgi:hypothetical protein
MKAVLRHLACKEMRFLRVVSGTRCYSLFWRTTSSHLISLARKMTETLLCKGRDFTELKGWHDQTREQRSGVIYVQVRLYLAHEDCSLGCRNRPGE